jgi:hypothetical protein
MIDFDKIEMDILYDRNPDPDYPRHVIEALDTYKAQIDYNCDRFIEQYGSKIDTETVTKYTRFMKIQSEEYSKITRLMRVINAYAKS